MTCSRENRQCNDMEARECDGGCDMMARMVKPVTVTPSKDPHKLKELFEFLIGHAGKAENHSMFGAAENLRRWAGMIYRMMTETAQGQEVRITASNVVVAVAVYWNYDMKACPQGKVQLLSRDNLPTYGVYRQGDPFYIGWAGIPENRPGH